MLPMTYREEVQSEMYRFRAKLLVIIGMMNAGGITAATSDMLESILRFNTTQLDAWKLGAMLQVEVSFVQMGHFNPTEDDKPPIDTPETHTDLDPRADDFPF